jgi:DNA-binding protein HU-beta
MAQGRDMSTPDLIRIVGKRADVPQKVTGEVIKELQKLWVEELSEGNTVTITGIGNISIGERAARVGRNPHTGAKIKIKARKSLKFKGFPSLKRLINGE